MNENNGTEKIAMVKVNCYILLQKSDDPLIIQPASLDIATVKKKADDDWVSSS